MKIGNIEFAPDYQSQSRSEYRRLQAQGAAPCAWCGRLVKREDRREIEIKSEKFKVCPKCPPPDNPNGTEGGRL